jgi:mono/diheme cytochrome c family protein
MNKNTIISILAAGSLFAVACNSGDIRRNPGKTYVPDMVYSQAYDAYTKGPVEGEATSLKPVTGTIARGHALPTHLTKADTTQYYALKSPYKFTEQELAEGKVHYDIHCGICHGQKMDGQGPLFTSGKFAAMPANLLGENYINMSEGKMYYAVMYGKGVMGSYASQLKEHDRWKVIAYIKQIQSQNGGAAFTMLADGNTTVVPTTANVDSNTVH